MEQDAGYILTENLQDRSTRSGLSVSNWNPSRSAAKKAVEWWDFDWEYAQSPVSGAFGGLLICVLSHDASFTHGPAHYVAINLGYFDGTIR